MNKMTLTLAVSAALASPLAMASDHNWLGAYLVGQFGQATTDIKGPDRVIPGSPESVDGNGDIVPATPDTVIPGKLDSADSFSYRVGVGYRLNRALSVEAAFVDVGRFNMDGTKVRANGVSVGAAAHLPLNVIYGPMDSSYTTDTIVDRTSLYVRVDAQHLAVQVDGGKKDRNTTPAVAIGIETNLPQGVSVRGEYQRAQIEYLNDKENVDIISVGFMKKIGL